MTAGDVDRLYTMLADLRDEVHGYRKDLNGRLRKLETAEAHRQGAEVSTQMSRRSIVAWSGLVVAAASVTTTILLHFTSAV